MKINPQITVKDIASHIGLSISGVEKNIRQLKKEGKIKHTRSTKNGKWIVTE